MRKKWYEELKIMPFEYTEINVPCAWHEALTAQFGENYMIPDKEYRGHDYPFYGCMEETLFKQIRAVGFMGTVEEFCQQVSSGKLRV